MLPPVYRANLPVKKEARFLFGEKYNGGDPKTVHSIPLAFNSTQDGWRTDCSKVSLAWLEEINWILWVILCLTNHLSVRYMSSQALQHEKWKMKVKQAHPCSSALSTAAVSCMVPRGQKEQQRTWQASHTYNTLAHQWYAAYHNLIHTIWWKWLTAMMK